MVDENTLKAAHEASRYNRKALGNDKKCGCYYCLKEFDPSKIKEWIPELDPEIEETALCPYCDMDSVLPEKSGFPLTEDFLMTMMVRWFGKPDFKENMQIRGYKSEEQ